MCARDIFFLQYIGIGIHLTEGDQNFMSSSAAAPGKHI